MDIPLSIAAFIILSPERHIVVTLNKTASAQNREKNLFQKNSLFQRWFSNLTMKMLAKATSIFVPMAVPWVCR